MTSLSKFPLFQLPRLALEEVLSNFDYQEMLILLICYPRLRHFNLISAKVRHLHNIALSTTSGCPQIFFVTFDGRSFTQDGLPKREVYRLVEIDEQVNSSDKTSEVVKIDEYKGYLLIKKEKRKTECFNSTYWENEMIGVMALTDLLCDMYRVEVKCLTIQKSTMWALDFIKSRQTAPLRHLIVGKDRNEKLTNEVIKQVLTNSRCKAMNVSFTATIPQDLKIDYTLGKFRFVTFYHGTGLTLKNLLVLGESCKEITIKESQFSLLDLKAVMKHWWKGRMKAVRVIKIAISGFLNFREEFFRSIRQYKTRFTGKLYYQNCNTSLYYRDGGVGYKRGDTGLIRVLSPPGKNIVVLVFFRRAKCSPYLQNF